MADVLSSVKFYKRLLEKEDPGIDLVAIYEIIEMAINSNVDEFVQSVYGFILEAEGSRDEKTYLRTKEIIRKLTAEKDYREKERWDDPDQPYELISIDWNDEKTTIPLPILKYYLSRLGNLKRYLEAISPDLTAPTPKDTQAPTPDEIEPQDAPNEATSELYAGLEWKADLADLAELIKGLRYKQAIHKNGRPITIEGLQLIFEKLFNVKVKKIHDTFRERMNNKIDPSFLQKLSELNKKMHEQNKNSNKYR